MATTLLLLGKLCFGVVAAAVGVQLVRSAREQSGVGVHTLAAGVICIGGLSMLVVPIGRGLGDSGPGPLVTLIGESAMRVAIVGLGVFVWRTFRASSPLAAAGVAMLALAIGASYAWELVEQPSWTAYDATRPSAYAMQAAFALPFAWSAIETGLHAARMRRQVKLGIAPPELALRFFVWAVVTTAFVAICALGALVPWLVDAGHATAAEWALSVRALAYVFVAGGVWLGMLAPAALRERVAVRI